ncbi:MAG: hypothetical protein LBF34_00550 [Puniceicoccales bacterium]|jgi:hypothetical protein|nr:hypothetical protein [Puniceicoccales bacterium]
MKIKGWIMGVSWGFLCSSSWGAVDESVGSGPAERSELKESFRPEEEENDIDRLIRATKDYSDLDNRVTITDVLINHLYRDDLDLILQTLMENLDRDDREDAIEGLKNFIDDKGESKISKS